MIPMNENTIQSFDDYLDKKMTLGEMHAFEAKLDADPELKQAFEEYKSNVHYLNASLLKSKMDTWGKGPNDPVHAAKRKKTVAMVVSFIAFVVVLICLLLFYLLNNFWNQNRETYPNNLYATYFKIDSGLPVQMSASAHLRFDEGMSDYRNGNYAEAMEHWKHLENQNTDTLAFYYAMIDMHDDRLEAASKELKSIPNSSIFYTRAQWYLSLCYVGLNKVDAARKILITIIPNRSFEYIEEAKELYAKLPAN